MSKQSPNLEKLKALHDQKRDKGLCLFVIAVDENADLISSQVSIQDTCSQTPDTDTAEPIELLQKAEEFCRKTRVVANKCKVFVGNISYRVKSRELKEFFSPFGKVIYAQVINDRMKKRSRGFGFVTFSNEWEAQKAKDSTDQERTLENRVMKVCAPERKRKGCRISNQDTSLEEALEFFSSTGDGAVEGEDDDGGVSRSPVSLLNEYTMLHIFSYLSPKDRIRIERVCRRWRLLAIKSWHHTTHLDFRGAFTSFQGVGGMTDEILWSILRRGCFNLKSLDLSASPHFLTDFAVHCIGKQCKLLKEIDLSGVDVNTSSLKALSKGCPLLERVTLQKCYRVGEKALWWLFKNCKKLTHVDLAGNKSLKGQCFFMLSPFCVSLHLRECTQLTDKGLNYLGEKCKNLDNIDISECVMVTDDGFLQLTQHCFMIQSLKFSKPGPNVTSGGLQGIGNLSLLRELDISQNSVVNDEVLFTIGRRCIHLTSLNLESCQGGITDAGIQCLVSCYQLSSLVLSYLEKVTDEGVSHLAANGTLERFVARACVGLTDKAIEPLLQHCFQMTVLDVSGCYNITNSSLELLTLYCTSDDRPVLTWTVGGTAIEEEAISQIQQAPCRCNVVPDDLSFGGRVDAVPSHGSGAFYHEDDEEDEFDECDDEDEADHFDNALDDDETWMAEDSLWWRPEDAVDFLEADYPSLLAEQFRT